eukprot:8275530-Pyramimonas_sp.AAC.1
MAVHGMHVRRAKFNEWVERQARGGGGGIHALTKVPAYSESSPAECLDDDRPYMPADLGGRSGGPGERVGSVVEVTSSS